MKKNARGKTPQLSLLHHEPVPSGNGSDDGPKLHSLVAAVEHKLDMLGVVDQLNPSCEQRVQTTMYYPCSKMFQLFSLDDESVPSCECFARGTKLYFLVAALQDHLHMLSLFHLLEPS